MIPGRRWLAARNYIIGPWLLAPAGAVIGFLTGIVVSTGPISVPVFTAYGLVKGAFIATEAPLARALYQQGHHLPHLRRAADRHRPRGLITGSSVMAGTYLARLLVERLSVAVFQHLLEVVMLVSGLSLLWAALR